MSSHKAFDLVYKAGGRTLLAGIYRCVGCGDEVAVPAGTLLPSERQHAHKDASARPGWQLIVSTQAAS